MTRTGFFLLSIWLLAASAAASDMTPAKTDPRAGECAIFSEGGNGRIFKTPTYWVKGTISSVSREIRIAGRCPKIAKSLITYTRDDWVRIAAATPCVKTDAEVREVEVLRIRLSVDEWETPWSHQHGTVGWLFRGYFLDTPLKKGEIIDMDASWLERCGPGK